MANASGDRPDGFRALFLWRGGAAAETVEAPSRRMASAGVDDNHAGDRGRRVDPPEASRSSLRVACPVAGVRGTAGCTNYHIPRKRTSIARCIRRAWRNHRGDPDLAQYLLDRTGWISKTGRPPKGFCVRQQRVCQFADVTGFQCSRQQLFQFSCHHLFHLQYAEHGLRRSHGRRRDRIASDRGHVPDRPRQKPHRVAPQGRGIQLRSF